MSENSRARMSDIMAGATSALCAIGCIYAMWALGGYGWVLRLFKYLASGDVAFSGFAFWFFFVPLVLAYHMPAIWITVGVWRLVHNGIYRFLRWLPQR